jgi:hypothetical protein
MHCRRAEERIQALLDERTPLDSDHVLSRHLAECLGCRERAHTYQRIALAFWQPRRSIARVEYAPLDRSWRWSRFPVPAALAAGLACVALWFSQEPAAVDRQIAPTDRRHFEAVASAPRERAAHESHGGAASEAAVDWFALSSMSVALSVSLEQLPPTRQWVEPVSGGFKPVTRSVEAAFGAMRDTVLGLEPAARS